MLSKGGEDEEGCTRLGSCKIWSVIGLNCSSTEKNETKPVSRNLGL